MNLNSVYFRSDYPQLGTQGSWGSKTQPMKGNAGSSLNRQKSISGRPVEYSLSSAASANQHSLKGKKNASTKVSGIKFWDRLEILSSIFQRKKGKTEILLSSYYTEATDFKEWCESECVRLVGSKGII